MPSSKAPDRPLPEVPSRSISDTRSPVDKSNKIVVSRLTSLLLERQNLEAQLCTLENIMETYDCSRASVPPRRPSAREEPFNERLAGLMSSFTPLSTNVKPSLYPKLLARSVSDLSFQPNSKTRPQPLNPQIPPHSVEQPRPESPNFKKTVDVLKNSYSNAILRLAEIELEIELVYLRGDIDCAREKRERREASVYRPKAKIDIFGDSLDL